MEDDDPNDRNSPDFWSDADDVEGVEAARQLNQQGEFWPENTARGRTSADLCATFVLEGSTLRNLIRSAVPFASLTNPKHTAMFSVANGTIEALMRRGGVWTKSRFHITDDGAAFATEPLIFSMPLWKADRLSSAVNVLDGRVDGRKKLWQIVSRVGKRSKKPDWLNVQIAPIHPSEVEPWELVDRGAKVGIDPNLLRRGLAYVNNAAKRQDHPNFSVVEVRDGSARAVCSQAIVSASGEGLNGVAMTIDAADVPTICRLLRRMDANKTTISTAGDYYFIESVALSIAVRIPKTQLPPGLDTLIASAPASMLKLSSCKVGLRTNAASVVKAKGSPLEMSLQSTPSGAIVVKAEAVGTYKSQLDALVEAEPAMSSEMPTLGTDETHPRPVVSARVDQAMLTDILWPMEGADLIEIGKASNGLLVKTKMLGLTLQGILATVGEVHDLEPRISNG